MAFDVGVLGIDIEAEAIGLVIVCAVNVSAAVVMPASISATVVAFSDVSVEGLIPGDEEERRLS